MTSPTSTTDIKRSKQRMTMAVATFEQRRARFGERLRELREQAGFNGREFARILGEGWTQSRVSKLETGKQTASEEDVIEWLDAVGGSELIVEQLLEDLRRLRVDEVAWRRQIRNGQRKRQAQIAGLEENAGVIRGVSISCVPGLLQTADYARTMFSSQADLHDTDRDVDAAVLERLRRQQVLYQPDKRIEILIAETALLHPIAPPQDMATQIDRLGMALDLPTVRFGVLPATRRLPHVPLNGYWILDEQVLVESVTAELRITDPDQLATYHRLTDRLWTTAAEAEEAQALLRKLSQHYATQNTSA
jgi:transcriptional regulator with XRE-family HTH domain